MASLTIISSCKKDIIEVPPSSMGEPVFMTNLLLDGTPHDFTAGINDYYMYTEWTKDANDVHTFIGRFAEEGCNTDCKESLQFEIRDITPTTTPDMNYALTSGTMAFADKTTIAEDIYQVQFQLNTDIENPTEITWSFGDDGGESAFNIADPIYNYVKRFDPYYPTCNVEDGINRAAFSGTLSHDMPSDCKTDYKVETNQNGNLVLTATPNSSANPFFYTWNYGLGNSGNLETFEIELDAIDSELDCFLEIFYDDGCSSNVSRTFTKSDNGDITYVSTSYDYEIIQEITDGTLLQLATFAVQYTDPDGKIYRSDLQTQSVFDSSFRILSIEDYQNNENGERTKKLTVEFDCKVFAADGSEKRIEKTTAIIAVAYPG